MHCPKCGQQQVSDDIRFCSRCGFLLTGIAQVIDNNGVVPALTPHSGTTPRRRGVYQGIFIFLLSFLIVPLISMITIFLNAEPFGVAIAAIVLTVGGLLRIAYALMFESSDLGGKTLEQSMYEAVKQVSPRDSDVKALPPEQSIPATAYTAPAAGRWLDTNDLAKTPGSVTDSTTKLLQREESDQ